MFLWLTRSLNRLGRWLIRKTRQDQCNMSHCGVLSRRRVQAKSWTSNFCFLLGPVQWSYPNFSLGGGNRHITCLKHISLSRTWWCCWKVNDTTFHEGFCLGVGNHEGLIARVKFCRDAIIQCMFLESFNCRS